MLSPSEEVTKTWVLCKGVLLKSRPEPTRFSFAVCLAIVFSIAFGFLGGFITVGFALNENYGSVYDSLLAELENARRCVEREKEKLLTIGKMLEVGPREPSIATNFQAIMTQNPSTGNQIHDQAIFSVLVNASEKLQKKDINGDCNQLKTIIKLDWNNQIWRNKIENLLNPCP